MGEIVNLRTRRKAKARDEQELLAAQNRAHFGLPKHLKQAAETSRMRDERNLDAKKLETITISRSETHER